MTDITTLRERQKAGQGHLLKFYNELNAEEQASLVSQLEKLDIERVNRIVKKALETMPTRYQPRRRRLSRCPQTASTRWSGQTRKIRLQNGGSTDYS